MQGMKNINKLYYVRREPLDVGKAEIIFIVLFFSEWSFLIASPAFYQVYTFTIMFKLGLSYSVNCFLLTSLVLCFLFPLYFLTGENDKNYGKSC